MNAEKTIRDKLNAAINDDLWNYFAISYAAVITITYPLLLTNPHIKNAILNDIGF